MKNELLRLRDELRLKSARGNFSRPENMHLTLVFLSECDLRETAAVKAAMDSVAFAPFDVTIDRVGRFRRDGGDIWWAGASDNTTLTALQRDLTDSLIAAGFDLDRRKYSPHITLGREVKSDAVARGIKPFSETARSVELMKSERADGKLTYTPIYVRTAAF